MIPSIAIHIITKDNTLRGNLSMLLPDDRDERVVNRDYRLDVVNFGIHAVDFGLSGPIILRASIKCHNKDDVLIVLNNLRALIINDEGKLGEGSWIGIHSYGHEENKPCSLEKVWSK
jgi:hypothetical protein